MLYCTTGNSLTVKIYYFRRTLDELSVPLLYSKHREVVYDLQIYQVKIFISYHGCIGRGDNAFSCLGLVFSLLKNFRIITIITLLVLLAILFILIQYDS